MKPNVQRPKSGNENCATMIMNGDTAIAAATAFSTRSGIFFRHHFAATDQASLGLAFDLLKHEHHPQRDGEVDNIDGAARGFIEHVPNVAPV